MTAAEGRKAAHPSPQAGDASRDRKREELRPELDLPAPSGGPDALLL